MGNRPNWNQGLRLCHMLNVRIYSLTSKVTPSSSFKNEKLLLTRHFSVLFKRTRDYRVQSMYWHQWHTISQLTLVRAKPERQRCRGWTAVNQPAQKKLKLCFWTISIKRREIYGICVMSQRCSHSMGHYTNQSSSRSRHNFKLLLQRYCNSHPFTTRHNIWYIGCYLCCACVYLQHHCE